MPNHSRLRPPGAPPPRPGYVLIFRPWITRNGVRVRRPDGRPWALWVKAERS